MNFKLELSLPLFMLGGFAQTIEAAFSPYQFAIYAHLFYGCSYLHLLSLAKLKINLKFIFYTLNLGDLQTPHDSPPFTFGA